MKSGAIHFLACLALAQLPGLCQGRAQCKRTRIIVHKETYPGQQIFLEAKNRDGGTVRICQNNQGIILKKNGLEAFGSPMKWTSGHEWVFDAEIDCNDAHYGGTTNGEDEHFLEARFVMGQWANGDSWSAVREPETWQRTQVCPGSALLNRRMGSHLLQNSHSVKCGAENRFTWGQGVCTWNIL